MIYPPVSSNVASWEIRSIHGGFNQKITELNSISSSQPCLKSWRVQHPLNPIKPSFSYGFPMVFLEGILPNVLGILILQQGNPSESTKGCPRAPIFPGRRTLKPSEVSPACQGGARVDIKPKYSQNIHTVCIVWYGMVK